MEGNDNVFRIMDYTRCWCCDKLYRVDPIANNWIICDVCGFPPKRLGDREYVIE